MVKRIDIICILFFLTNIFLFSEDQIEINLSLNNSETYLNEWFQVNLQISSSINDIKIKKIETSDPSIIIQQVGQSNMTTYINGVLTTSTVLSYYCKIQKQGTYEIGPFILDVKDKEYTTKTIKVTINDSNNTNNINQNDNLYNESSNNEENFNYYILKSNTSKKEAYVNEYIDIDVKFYQYPKAFIKNHKYASLQFPTTAWVERFKYNKNNNKVRLNNDVYYEYEVEKERIYISKPGTYTIQPAEVIIFGTTQDSFLPTEIKIKTNPIILKINPLPENPPKYYNEAVGTFKINYNLEKNKIKNKTPVTLKISLDGEGNFQNIKDINYSIDKSIDVYSSKSNISPEDNTYKTKTWEILLIPSQSGNFKIKINDFTFFDINQKKYITLNGKEFNLEVLKNEKKEETDSSVLNEDNIKDQKNDTSINQNLESIQYIKLKLGNRINSNTYNLWFKIILLSYSILIISIILFISLKFLLFNLAINSKALSSKNAYKIFIKRIGLITKKINKTPYNEMIDNISIIIEKYFINKFNIDSIEFTNKSIEEKLGNSLSNTSINKLKDIIKELDMIRFGGFDISKEQFNSLITTINEFIKNIEYKEKNNH